MSMSPENYRLLERECNTLIQKAELYLQGKHISGKSYSMEFVFDAMGICNEISQRYQECITAAKNAKTSIIRGKYDNLAAKLNSLRERILERHKGEC